MKPIHWLLLLAGLGGTGYAAYWTWKRMAQVDLFLPSGPEDVPDIEGAPGRRRAEYGAAATMAEQAADAAEPRGTLGTLWDTWAGMF